MPLLERVEIALEDRVQMLYKSVYSNVYLTVPEQYVGIKTGQLLLSLQVSRGVSLRQARANRDARVYDFLYELELFGNHAVDRPLGLAALLGCSVDDELIKLIVLGGRGVDVLQGIFCSLGHALDEVFPDNLRGLVDEEDVQVGQKLNLIADLVDFGDWCLHAYRCQRVVHRNRHDLREAEPDHSLNLIQALVNFLPAIGARAP